MLRNLSEKLGAKFPATTLSNSMARIARLDDAFSESFELEPSPVEGQSLQQKDKKRRKRKGKNITKTETPKDVGHFLVQKLEILIPVHAQARHAVMLQMPFWVYWRKFSPYPGLKSPKGPQNAFLAKSSGSQ